MSDEQGVLRFRQGVERTGPRGERHGTVRVELAQAVVELADGDRGGPGDGAEQLGQRAVGGRGAVGEVCDDRRREVDRGRGVEEREPG